jgi:hypothetical protein
VILEERSCLWTGSTNSSDSVVNLFVRTLKASSLISVPVTWLETLNTLDTSIKRQIVWTYASSTIFVVDECLRTALTFFIVIIPKTWIVA